MCVVDFTVKSVANEFSIEEFRTIVTGERKDLKVFEKLLRNSGDFV